VYERMPLEQAHKPSEKTLSTAAVLNMDVFATSWVVPGLGSYAFEPRARLAAKRNPDHQVQGAWIYSPPWPRHTTGFFVVRRVL